MRAGEVSKATGASIKALRYYEERGFISPGHGANLYREYSVQDVRIVSEIRALSVLGIGLQQTRPFLDCLRDGHEHSDDCPQSLAAYQQRIDQLDSVISRLTSTRRELDRQMNVAARRGFRSVRTQMKETNVSLPQADALPNDLPAPEDDGGARHLPGRQLPPLTFNATDGKPIKLDDVAAGRWVLYLYPLTGEPGRDVPRGWDEIPGARGCSQEACSFRDNLSALQALGVAQVLALSTDPADYQRDLVDRLHLPYSMLSDPQLCLARALDLPTFEGDGQTLYKRLTLVVHGSTIEHVFYPIFPPDKHADEVLAWLAANPRTSETSA